MIELPPEIQTKYDSDFADYQKQILALKVVANQARLTFLHTEYKPFTKICSKDERIKFILQFKREINYLILFPDDEVINKLKELGFPTRLLVWFTDLSEIEKELFRLRNIKGLFFLINIHLTSIRFHLESSIFIGMINEFIPGVKYNNTKTNFAFKDASERFRRREYNKKRNQVGKMDLFEELMNGIIDFAESNIEDADCFRKYLLQTLKGNTNYCIETLGQFYCEGISQRKVYFELFPLFQLILKGRLLSEDEFNAINSKKFAYNGDYKEYQIISVQKILRKK